MRPDLWRLCRRRRCCCQGRPSSPAGHVLPVDLSLQDQYVLAKLEETEKSFKELQAGAELRMRRKHPCLVVAGACWLHLHLAMWHVACMHAALVCGAADAHCLRLSSNQHTACTPPLPHAPNAAASFAPKCRRAWRTPK